MHTKNMPKALHQDTNSPAKRRKRHARALRPHSCSTVEEGHVGNARRETERDQSGQHLKQAELDPFMIHKPIAFAIVVP
jgi:hypothetical protein